MRETFEKLKTVDWLRVGHWLIFPAAIIIAKYVGGFGGWFLWMMTHGGMERAGIDDMPPVIYTILQTLFAFIFSLIASLQTSFNFVPNIKYRYNALFLTGGVYIGIEIRNFISHMEKYETFRPLFLIDIVFTSIIVFLIIQHILKEHPQNYGDSSV